MASLRDESRGRDTRTLELLREFDVKATFFVLGWVAEEMPELVRGIAAEGDEVASLTAPINLFP